MILRSNVANDLEMWLDFPDKICAWWRNSYVPGCKIQTWRLPIADSPWQMLRPKSKGPFTSVGCQTLAHASIELVMHESWRCSSNRSDYFLRVGSSSRGLVKTTPAMLFSVQIYTFLQISGAIHQAARPWISSTHTYEWEIFSRLIGVIIYYPLMLPAFRVVNHLSAK